MADTDFAAAIIPGAILLPIGLFLTGWTARASIHWIVPDIGILIIGGGMILIFQGIQTYVIDAFTLHAASGAFLPSPLRERMRLLMMTASTALAVIAFFRSIAGFTFPLFAPAMYNALGYGKGDTILACVAIGVGIPAYVFPTFVAWFVRVADVGVVAPYFPNRPFLLWMYGERLRKASRYAKRT